MENTFIRKKMDQVKNSKEETTENKLNRKKMDQVIGKKMPGKQT